MCGHGFFYQDRHHLQRHRPQWHCSTCGRVSFVPLDCCTQPDFTHQSSPGLVSLLHEWVGRCGRWTLASVRLLWGWQRHPATSAAMTDAAASPHSVVTASVMSYPAESDESVERDETVMVAGAPR